MSRKERAAWTALIDGKQPAPNKYGAKRTGKYASKAEATEAAKLHALANAGSISDLQEQVPFTLVQGDGRIRGIVYIADFVWKENGETVVADKKGYRTPVYKLKKKMMRLLLGIDIREL